MRPCYWITNNTGAHLLMHPGRNLPIAGIIPYAYQSGYHILITIMAETEKLDTEAASVEDGKKIIEPALISAGWTILTEEQMNLM